MTIATDLIFNITEFKISEDFSLGFLQLGYSLVSDINAFSHLHSFSDFVSLVEKTYDDTINSGLKISFEDTNVLTGKPGISLVLTKDDSTIGTIGVSGPLLAASHFVETLLHL
jgi:hypothetical protein